ncbi:MAG: universal stress protein UspA [Pseudonocardiales bacterium]|nr:MAG: universal stress protein UspA [Pseudonocardiales bacterium]
MPAQQEGRVPRIVAGVDGSPSSMEALCWAARQAGLTGATVDAVIGWQFPAGYGGAGWTPNAMVDDAYYGGIARKALADAISQAVAQGGGVTVLPRVVEGHPAQVLMEAADGADLLVVGSRGHGGFTGALLGSVSQHCVQHAHCPVVVIRGDVHH